MSGFEIIYLFGRLAMKRKWWKVAVITLVIAAMLGVVTYADKEKKITLPAAVKAAISALYPNAEIDEVEIEEEGLKVYEIELEENEDEFDVTVAPDGTIVEVETEISLDDLPAAVKAAILAAADGAQVEEVSKEVTYAVVTLVELEEPQTSYEVELVKDGNEVEIEVAADGTVLSLEAKDEDEDHDNDDEDEDDDDDD